MDILLMKLTVSKKEEIDKGENKLIKILIPGEVIEHLYSDKGNSIWFTNKRIIILENGGLVVKKNEYRTIPYGKICSFIVDTINIRGLRIWIVGGIGEIILEFKNPLDIEEIGRYLGIKTL
ncbi:hypothetical protein E0494_01655 [Marinilabiliaceae bacterium JC040]|nr:hypothetical protein [Marinilabiliaceae bacterium JC040]